MAMTIPLETQNDNQKIRNLPTGIHTHQSHDTTYIKNALHTVATEACGVVTLSVGMGKAATDNAADNGGDDDDDDDDDDVDEQVIVSLDGGAGRSSFNVPSPLHVTSVDPHRD
ncbi:hypothetical protein VNO77_18460 [Canavalia gladiata]|uniref:Uncharacterized protein n=1 Tax=Canavalia gladiata TaxID=3824 RepID=A0AAN9LKV2_CANGL